MKKKLLAGCLALVFALGLTACGGTGATDSEDTANLQGSAEATDVNVGLIMGPPSMGLGWFMQENEDGNTFNHYNFEVAGVDYSAVSASLGLLYVLTTDPSINSMEDLSGRTVYSIGEGGPPEYTFEYLLKNYQLDDSVNFSFRATPFEVLNLLQEEPNSIALLPQPFVEVAKMLVPDLRVAINVTDAWDALNVESGAQSVTTVTVVRTKFLEEHEQAVKEYLEMAKKSTDYCLKNLDEAAQWTEKYETFLNPDIAKNAIPECNIVTITGQEMKDILSGFLQIIDDSNPDAVGGSMPDDDFYYIP